MTISNSNSQPQPSASSQTTRSLLRRLMVDFAKPYSWVIVAGFVCMAIGAVTTAFLAKQMEPIVNDIFIRHDGVALPWIVLGVLIIFLLKGLSSYGESVAMSYVGQKLVSDGQRKIYSALIQADLAYVHTTPVGQLVARATNDVEVIGKVVTDTVTRLGKDTLTFSALLGVMFYQDWVLACFAFTVFPVAILPVVRIGKRIRKTATGARQSIANFTSLLTQSLQGARMIKSYGLEDLESQRAIKNIREIFRYYYKGARIGSLTHPIMEFLGGIAIVIVISYGGYQVIEGDKTAGAFFSFITALIMAYEPMKSLARLNATLQEGLASVSRSFEVMDLKPTIQNLPGAINLDIKKGEISLEDVSFSYTSEKPVLKNVSLRVKPGQKVALVGPSGGGKSTIINLIPRLYDISEGSGCVVIEGNNVRDVTLESLRSSIALVSQDVILFDDTIFANIAFGRQDATLEEVKTAAKASAAHDFIEALPQGYDTVIGEQGLSLSGGQRQRISIARAMVRNAPILLLDEATSALDSESEAHIQKALKALMKGKTTLIIAHRLSTVVDADCLYFIEEGRVTSFGTHSELLKKNPRYAALCAAQFHHSSGRREAPLAEQLGKVGDTV
ncbi:MAG: ABC transporter ATP-binding protein [bacterium]|nr:ABC transporter ATP-binding protein [bacterium]